MSNKAWRIVALLFIVVPIIICIIISFIITYFPTSDVSLILASDFLPIAIKIQGVGILIAFSFRYLKSRKIKMKKRWTSISINLRLLR